MNDRAEPRKRAPIPALILATGFGSGYSPIIPGTAGTAACAVLLWLARPLLGPFVDLALVVVVTFLAILTATPVALAASKKDPSIVVLDEFAGFMTSLALLPKTWPYFLAAFFLFRLLDILKPPPCRRLERLPGGWGITLDDVMAGIYANLLLQVARLFIG